MRFIRNNSRTQEDTPADESAESSITARLVKKAVHGDVEAFGELYGIFMGRIYRYVFHHVNDKMAAEDITEEVFVKAWRAIGSCRGRERTFSSWLYRIARNHAIDAIRRQKKQQTIERDMPGSDVVGVAAENRVERQELLMMISGLPPNQKQVVLLKFIEGLDNPEIGHIMKKSEGAVRVLQMRALSSLRRQLSKEA